MYASSLPISQRVVGNLLWGSLEEFSFGCCDGISQTFVKVTTFIKLKHYIYLFSCNNWSPQPQYRDLLSLALALCITCTLHFTTFALWVSALSFLRFIERGLPFLGRGHRGHWRPYPIARAFIVCFLQLRDLCIWEISFIMLIDFSIYFWEIS